MDFFFQWLWGGGAGAAAAGAVLAGAVMADHPREEPECGEGHDGDGGDALCLAAHGGGRVQPSRRVPSWKMTKHTSQAVPVMYVACRAGQIQDLVSR